MMQVSIVPTEHVFAMWPKVRAHLSKCVEYTHGRFEVEDMLEMIVDGEQDLWIAYDDESREIKGVVTTGYSNYPRQRALVMQFTGGEDIASWKEPMLQVLQQWAFDNHCDVIECSGRPGWAKIFDADGHKPLWQTFELPVIDHGLGGDDGR